MLQNYEVGFRHITFAKILKRRNNNIVFQTLHNASDYIILYLVCKTIGRQLGKTAGIDVEERYSIRLVCLYLFPG